MGASDRRDAGRRALSHDDKDACTRIGVGFDTGRRPDTASKANARQFYARGCELFSAIACNNLGVLVGRGFAGPGDLDRRAMPFYEEACSMGYAPGCSSVARRLVRDPQQAARGRAMLQQQCSTGLGAACDDLGLHLLPTEPARAVAFFREACAADNDQCDSALRAGVVAPEQQKSVRAAVVSLCIASDPTLETDSCKVAGVANLCGFGGPVNEAQGLSLLERACVASRKPGACTLYAEALVEQTSPKAVDVARVACDAGDVDGCALVAHLSDGTVREALLAEACTQGSWRACRAASGGAFAVGACTLPVELKPAL